MLNSKRFCSSKDFKPLLLVHWLRLESVRFRREQRATFDIGMAYDQLKAEQAREQYARQQIAQGIVGTTAGIARAAVTFGAEQGAKVTPGEFSHDTNPIDIVQEGTKIGEMTGGQYIFNPQQAGKMAREAKKGVTIAQVRSTKTEQVPQRRREV